jgi:hypothetical protein
VGKGGYAVRFEGPDAPGINAVTLRAWLMMDHAKEGEGPGRLPVLIGGAPLVMQVRRECHGRYECFASTQ